MPLFQARPECVQEARGQAESTRANVVNDVLFMPRATRDLVRGLFHAKECVKLVSRSALFCPSEPEYGRRSGNIRTTCACVNL